MEHHAAKIMFFSESTELLNLFFVLFVETNIGENERHEPLILLSNDDGVQAKGLNELMDMLSPLGDILVMAPDGARSGSACAITAHDPLRYRVVAVRPGIKICAC